MLPPQEKKKKSLSSYVNACTYNASSHLYNSVIKSKFKTFTFPQMIYVIQGVQYKGEAAEGTELRKHLDTLFRVTYRNGFSYHLPHCSLTTDAGWGCTIRSMQMLYLNSLVRLQQPDPGNDQKAARENVKQNMQVFTNEIRREYVELIEDVPKAEAIFSLYKMFNLQIIRSNNQKGTKYLSPSLCATAFQQLNELWDERKCNVIASSTFPKDVQENTILFLSAPLNSNTIDALDYTFVGGVVTGVDNKAFCVIGRCGNCLILLDPHPVQKATENGDIMIEYYVKNKNVNLVELDKVAFGNAIWSILLRKDNIEYVKKWCKDHLGISYEGDVKTMVSVGEEDGFEVLEF